MNNKLKLFVCTVNCALLFFNCSISASGKDQDRQSERKPAAASTAAPPVFMPAQSVASVGGQRGGAPMSIEAPAAGVGDGAARRAASIRFPRGQYKDPRAFCVGVVNEIKECKDQKLTDVTLLLPSFSTKESWGTEDLKEIFAQLRRCCGATLKKLSLSGLFEGIGHEQEDVVRDRCNQVKGVMRDPGSLEKFTFSVPGNLEEILYTKFKLSRIYGFKLRRKFKADSTVKYPYRRVKRAATGSAAGSGSTAGGAAAPERNLWLAGNDETALKVLWNSGGARTQYDKFFESKEREVVKDTFYNIFVIDLSKRGLDPDLRKAYQVEELKGKKEKFSARLNKVARVVFKVHEKTKIARILKGIHHYSGMKK